jgi:hypothetical protein
MGRRDELRGEMDREAEERHQGLLRADANLQARRAWDAWVGVRRDEAADAARLLRRREQAGARYAEKLAGRGRDVRERDAKLLRARRHWAARWALCKQGAGRSGA